MKIGTLRDGERNLIPETPKDCEAILGTIAAYSFINRDPHITLMLSYGLPEDANPLLPDDSELERIANQTAEAHRALTSDNPRMKELQLPVAYDTSRRRNLGDLTAALRICEKLVELVSTSGKEAVFSGDLAAHVGQMRQTTPMLRAVLLPEENA